MALFEVTDYDRKIYNEELKDFIPQKIFDVHAHVWLDSLDIEKPADFVPSWPQMVAKENSIEDLQETYRLLFPDKDFTVLMFSNGCDDGSSEANNEYVASASAKTGWPSLYFSHPYQSPDELEAIIRKNGFLGIKSFLSLAPSYIPVNEVRIYDFFPKEQLKRMDELGAIVMCHIPRPKRLKDPVNLEQILEIKAEFPNIKLIMAHVGRAYTEGDIGNAFTDYLSKVPDLMYDFCANSCETAIRECIRTAGPEHVMYGNDMPILRMRCKRIEENGTYINLVPKGLYGDVSSDSHMREVSGAEAGKITFFAYEELLAFKRAATTLELTRRDIDNIMYGNAFRLTEAARKSIFG